MRSPSCIREQSGFTLIELIVSVLILGIIGGAVSQAVVVALTTTDGSVARISGAVASETLTSYLSADAHSADEVADPDSPACATGDPAGVFLRLSWTDGGTRLAEYSLEPATGLEQDIVRWFCVEGSAPSRRVLGHFSSDEGGPSPVIARCDGVSCTPAAQFPQRVTLVVNVPGGDPTELTIRRRAP